MLEWRMVREARRHEWSAIESWRKLHFSNLATHRPITGQKGYDDALWLVVERHGRPVAACSYTDNAQAKQRFVHDLYAAPGHIFAALYLGEILEMLCDKQGYEIRGKTDPENLKFLQVLLQRGYEMTAIEYRRPPRVPIEVSQASDSENSASVDRGSFHEVANGVNE